MDLCAHVPLRMHRIQAQDTPFDQGSGQERLESTDLILLLAYILMPQNNPSADLITAQLVNRGRLTSGRTKRFASPSPDARDRPVLVEFANGSALRRNGFEPPIG